ncbi:gag poly [Fusarium acutatum]|uniref:Gag poly n=1 Tax=Fusarium acutatum TaxID=78861 RepID=A0A8H4JQU6_9HYPO|nr:gag poly [Fusarium acutatum]
MSSNANTGPAPPYTGPPPSAAEMMAEVQQLHNTIRNLQAQMNACSAHFRLYKNKLNTPMKKLLYTNEEDQVVNEERQAAAELLTLKQHKSYAAYSAKFRQLTSKTEWDDKALIEIYYRGLKDEVKDELYKADRPEEGLTTYMTIAIKIDE